MVGSFAVVIDEAQEDGLVDHTQLHPSRAPMLDHVGQFGNGKPTGSIVYLGKGWVLTAQHAFEGRKGDLVTFAGNEFEVAPRSAVRLKNPEGSGLGGKADLVMLKLRSRPNLPALKISDRRPFAEELVVLVGCGAHEIVRSNPLVKVDQGDGVLRPEPILSDGKSGGEIPTGSRWGENTVSDRQLHVSLDGRDCGTTVAFATMRQPKPQPRNAQGAKGDSGGGVFLRHGNSWQLAGIMLSVIHREDLGASATFHADLSVYRGQIESTIPEPSAGLLLLAAAGICGLRRRR